MDNNSIKKNIQYQRKKNSISQKEMAERLGIARNAYRNIEKGDTKIISGHIDNIADILGVSLEELVLGYSPSDSSDTRLNDIVSEYQEKIKYYEAQLSEKDKTIDMLTRFVSELNKRIEDKDVIINLLKSKKL